MLIENTRRYPPPVRRRALGTRIIRKMDERTPQSLIKSSAHSMVPLSNRRRRCCVFNVSFFAEAKFPSATQFKATKTRSRTIPLGKLHLNKRAASDDNKEMIALSARSRFDITRFGCFAFSPAGLESKAHRSPFYALLSPVHHDLSHSYSSPSARSLFRSAT